MLMLRVQLPDRPGSLGQLATALGTIDADIEAMEIVDRFGGTVVDDFLIELPLGVLPEDLIGACSLVEDTHVMWISRYPAQSGLGSAFEMIQALRADMSASQQTLVDYAPEVFRAQWAILFDAETLTVTHRSSLAPELSSDQLRELAPFQSRQQAMGFDWVPGWGEQVVALTPRQSGEILICARHGGPEFLGSELSKLSLMALLSI